MSRHLSIRRPKYLAIDGCPCPYDVAPYAFLVLRRARMTASSIYRGDDPAAAPILRRSGKHTQRELYNASPSQRAAWGVSGTPNPPGRSTHELRSDGVAKPGPVGRVLEPWEIGIDSGQNTPSDVRAVREAALSLGLDVYHPYAAGVEEHHWGFRSRPRPNLRLSRTRVLITRARLRLAS